jgi:Putative adhesin
MHRIALLILGLCLVAPLARAEQWSKTFNLTGKPNLRVTTSDANIRVDTWDQNIIEAQVTAEGWKVSENAPGEHGVRVVQHQTGDAVDLEVRLPHTVCIVCIHPADHRVDVEIHMPREGRVNLRSSDGSIRLANLKGDMDLQSSDGALDVEGVDGALKAHASDGHIKIAGRFDSLQLSSSDGRIEARALAGSTISSGWSLHSGDGSVTVQLPAAFAADVELHTGDGHISLDMPVSVEGQLGHHDIRGKLNGGGNLLTIHTGDGSIRLEKS